MARVTVARRALGIAGEDAAAAWYVANGYEVVARNWRAATASSISSSGGSG